MSYQDGIAALNLEKTKRIPRTEYSVETHWPLINAVTGIKVDSQSTENIKIKASAAFMKAWNYDFIWSILINTQIFGKIRTSMGHAEYAAEGTDYNNEVFCPFKDPQDVLNFDPWQAYGKIDIIIAARDFEEHYEQLCQKFPDAVNMTGIYVTCVSGLIEIFGWDMMLMAMGTDPVKFGDLTNRYCSWISQYFDALAQSNVPVAMIHDDIVWTSGPFTSPEWYRTYIFPNYKKLFAPLIDSGKKVIYTSDGNYTQFIDDIASTGIHGFVLEPTTDMKYIAEKYGKTHSFVGNADTRILLDGTKKEIRNEVERCISIGKNCPGFFMAVGNHIPSNTPIENALYYNQVYEELSKR
ncbi:MAG: hypothetical protein A2Y10_13355 [Planctomycetes bacterium GWF2_41_51]|nr:MAG: hypothetical protein A2Y10_13355 [Planctomycetes bacterium GWF2_41_51]HBG26279.1 hypothetical protein [Phycisphaerales bacterium]